MEQADLYIYYKVRDADAPVLRERILALQQSLAGEHGVAGQLKRRPGSKDGLQTWMEVYPRTGEAFGEAVERAFAGTGITALLASPRHIEVFTDLA
ncbi:DUF4936 family protein [Pseudoduganella buxea]|uniref:DUF4936 family protein n=1 Tax=Pseudoduganella buxea TaxID=1949069 RepID=A0A6I3SYF3_9BURK|nr:DUF4936 family protein [Pseudoduganella buxea]MTV53596.1 DUF4936 family protein [Pseudoduganella buxea]GGC15612.1 hypothetical protein GCM10011572_41230 [Pseudoduganella buxea]